MLEKLLELIAQSGAVQTAALARQLDVSPALVEQMVAHLERMGYLSAVAQCAEDHCAGCTLKQGCGETHAKLWRMKGIR